MDLELMIRLAARLRCLSESEFGSLQRMIEHGEEDEQNLPAVTQALSDCCDLTNAYNQNPRMRLTPCCKKGAA